jgi:hypothetical protein
MPQTELFSACLFAAFAAVACGVLLPSVIAGTRSAQFFMKTHGMVAGVLSWILCFLFFVMELLLGPIAIWYLATKFPFLEGIGIALLSLVVSFVGIQIGKRSLSDFTAFVCPGSSS